MCKRSLIVAFCMISSLFYTMTPDQVLSQETGQNNRPPEEQNRQRGSMGQGMRGRGQMDPEQMMNMMSGRIKELLEMSDEDWTVIGPKLINVVTLSTQSTGPNMGRMTGMFMGRENTNLRNQRQPLAGSTDAGPISKAQIDLQELLEDKEAPTSEIKRKIIALREAKGEAEQKLATARNELRELLTVRQEALLIAMGYLD